MGDRNIVDDLTALGATPATDDYVVLIDKSTGAVKTVTTANLIDVAKMTNIWIPAGAMTALNTNGAEGGIYEYPTNDNMMDYFAFDGTTEEYVAFNLVMAEGWDRGTIKAKFYWSPGDSACSAADTVEWQLAGQAISDDDALDVALGDAGEVISDVVLAGKDGDLHITAATPAITIGGTPALGDMVHFKLSRNVGGDDDMTEDAWLFGVYLQIVTGDPITAW